MLSAEFGQELTLKAKGGRMRNIEDCLVLANRRLAQISDQCETDLVMLERTIELGNTIAFFYQSDEYVKTGNSLAALAGNGPILVDRRSGFVAVAGTALPLADYVKDFEAGTIAS